MSGHRSVPSGVKKGPSNLREKKYGDLWFLPYVAAFKRFAPYGLQKNVCYTKIFFKLKLQDGWITKIQWCT